MTLSEFQREFANNDDVPLLIEPYYGVRGWSATSDGVLFGERGWVWSDGENVAQCLAYRETEPHPVASARCGCGFYFYWDIAGLSGTTRGWASWVGIASGYGRVYLGTRGFKAAKSRILAIAPMPYLTWATYSGKGREYREAIARRYPSVRVFAEYTDVIREFPPTKREDV